jgi:hypothetical protein
LEITALSVCLLGFIGLIFVVWRMKTGAAGTPRALFIFLLGAICAPFYLAFVKAPKLPFLFAPVVAIFLLYPIAAPHGVVYSTDPIFNFSFTQDLLDTGFWAPGGGNAFAFTYSFYPIGNVFVGYVILNAPLPPDIGYLWIEPMLRLLAIPAIVYSIGRRLFGPRTAVIGVLLYLGTPSILFNLPIQQGFGTIFFGLSLLSLFILTQAVDVRAQVRASALFAVVSAAIVLTHHLSSYVAAFWLAALGVLILRRRARTTLPVLLLAVLFAYFIVLLLVYIDALTKPVFLGHELTLETVLRNLIGPEGSTTAPSGSNLGRTFSQLEIGWLAGSLIGLFLLSLLSVWRYRVTRHHPFAVANGIVASFLIFITLPLLFTLLNYVPLRINEYTGFIIMPFAAATLIRWARSDFWKSLRQAPRVFREKEWLPKALVLATAAAVVMGGNLAPLTMRAYFEPFLQRTTDSPLYLDVDSLRAADWSGAHFASGHIWGDQLSVDVFAGFGDLPVKFGSQRMFNGTALDNSTLKSWKAGVGMRVGDYVAVNRWMTILRPNFFQEGLQSTPSTPAELDKFATDPHFALVYQDATFSVYQVMSLPP